jgi:hypothetical protein
MILNGYMLSANQFARKKIPMTASSAFSLLLPSPPGRGLGRPIFGTSGP